MNRLPQRRLVNSRTAAGDVRIDALEGRCLFSAGALDGAFGSGGIVHTTNVGGAGPEHAVAVQADGKIVVGSIAPDEQSWLIARYNTNGSLDQTFASGGHFVESFGAVPEGGESNQPNAIAIAPDGSIYVGGQGNPAAGKNGNTPNAVLLKLSPTGAGVFIHQYNFNGVDVITSLAMQSNGDVVAAGSAGDGKTDGDNDFALMRFLPSGSLDTTFGTGGTVRLSAGGYLDQFEGVAVQPDEKIVAGGTIQDEADLRSPPSSGSIDIVRFNANGAVDTTFGGAGTGQFHYSFAGAYNSAVSGLALGPGGTIVAAGDVGYLNDSGFTNPAAVVLRLNSAGKFDTTFNKTGYVLTPTNAASGDASNLSAYSDVLVQSDGDIVADGAQFGASGGAIITRYLSSGAVDTSFGTKGSVIVEPSGTTAAVAQGVALQPDGKLVVIGEADVSQSVQRFLFRLTGDTGAISGTVFNDANGNGTQQSTETGVAGIELYLDLNNNQKIDPNEFTTVTDSLGHYTFLGVSPGSDLIVRQVLAAGTRQTSPANGFGQHVNVAVGVVVGNENFGVVPTAVAMDV